MVLIQLILIMRDAPFSLVKRYLRLKQIDLLQLSRMQAIDKKELNQQQILLDEPFVIGSHVMVYNRAKDLQNKSKLFKRWIKGYKVFDSNHAGTYLVGLPTDRPQNYKWINHRWLKIDPSMEKARSNTSPKN